MAARKLTFLQINGTNVVDDGTAAASLVPTNGVVVATGSVKSADLQDPNVVLYFVMFDGTSYSDANPAPPLTPELQAVAAQATPTQVFDAHGHPTGDWAWTSYPIQTYPPGPWDGDPCQIVVWSGSLNSQRPPTFVEVQNLTVQFPSAALRINAAIHGASPQFNILSNPVINHPTLADGPYPVNNAPGAGYGWINASGSVAAPANTSVYVKVYSGIQFPTGSVLPLGPEKGNVKTQTDSSGNWTVAVPTPPHPPSVLAATFAAQCSTSSPYLPNQLVVWAWDAAHGIYNSSFSNFLGKSVN